MFQGEKRSAGLDKIFRILTEIYNRPPTKETINLFLWTVGYQCHYCKKTNSQVLLDSEPFGKELLKLTRDQKNHYIVKYIKANVKAFIFRCKYCKSLKILFYVPGSCSITLFTIDRRRILGRLAHPDKIPKSIIAEFKDKETAKRPFLGVVRFVKIANQLHPDYVAEGEDNFTPQFAIHEPEDKS